MQSIMWSIAHMEPYSAAKKHLDIQLLASWRGRLCLGHVQRFHIESASGIAAQVLALESVDLRRILKACTAH